MKTALANRLWRRTFRFLASLRLAVFLLMVLIVATAIGTIYESRFDAKVARAYIYEAPWFNGWIVLLGVNLAAAAFSRYPWKRHHTGFVITHAGIITLLIGALVGRIWGIEGTMTLFVGHPPSNRLVVDQPEVRIAQGNQVAAFLVGIQRVHPPATQVLGTTPDGWKITMTDSAELLKAVPSPHEVNEGGNPAVQVKLWSAMGQKVEEWLWPDDPQQRQVDMGMLAVEVRRGTAPVKPPGNGVLKKVSTGAAPELPPGNRAVIYLGDDSKLTYTIQNKQGAANQGTLETGKPIATSWGDWQMEVVSVLPQAVPSTEFEPVAKNAKLPPREKMNCSEGVKVEISRDGHRYEEWLASGWQVDFPTPGALLQASYGPRIVALPITLELKNFEVERNEGLDTAAGFKSTIEVRDAVGNGATGSCSMNEPMEYPDSMWRTWTGLTYKISQASWNPENLKQSSVQILLDPGWLFKWMGSLMVCTGIFTMFYLRPPRDAAHP